MPKQIKLTDSVAAMLEERARRDELSLAGEVNKLLTEGGGGDLTGRLDYLESYLDKKFDELKSLIENNLVDVVAAGGGRAPVGKEWVPWDQMQYIIFTHDDDDPAWIIPEGAVFQFKNGDPTVYSYFVKDGTIFMDSVGRPEPLIKVTPEIREAIDKHFTYDE